MAQMDVTLELPFPGRGLSPNSRLHWRVKAAAVAGYREACGWIAKEAMQRLEAPLEPPVKADILYVLPDGRRRDPDNLLAMLKPAWDGMVDAGLLVDDRWQLLKVGEPRFEQGKKPGMVKVTLHSEGGGAWEGTSRQVAG